MLNSQSPIPLYHQLAEILLARIRSGEYPPEAKIPSEHRLAATFGIGRPTARQATDLLVRKGHLVRRRGAGTFVQRTPREIDLFSLAGTTAAFQEKGIAVETTLLRETCLKWVEGDEDNPFEGQEAYQLSRLSKVAGVPVLIEDISLHPGLFAGIEGIDLSGLSLSQVVDEHYYMRPLGGDQNFRIRHLSGDMAKALEVWVTTPILVVKRYIHFEQARNAIYAALYCRTDQFVFSQTLGGVSDE